MAALRIDSPCGLIGSEVAEEGPAGREHSGQSDFDTRIAALLTRRCLSCHSGSEPKGGLNLSRSQTAFAGGESGKAIIPGRVEKSLLWERVAADEMPPKKPLTNKEKELLKTWIASGAKWGTDPIDTLRYTSETRAGYDWWALQPVIRPQRPDVKNTKWIVNPIDRFVLHRLERAGLMHSPEADRRIVIRRLSFDLLGLPPAPEEVETFVKDRSADAYSQLVNRLLDSPHYGERWARHWLDVIRFGESQGFERDKLRPNAWRFRDWVVNALNDDMPYDEFVRMQLAGDVLHPHDSQAIIATGFLVAGTYDEVGQKQQSAAMKAVVRQDELEDIVSAVGQTFLGLTVNCARCHDHKFDPVTQAEYYQLASALSGIRHGERDVTGETLKKTVAEQTKTIQSQIDLLSRQLAEIPDDSVLENELLARLGPAQKTKREQIRFELSHLAELKNRAVTTRVYAVTPKQPEPTHLLTRGNPALRAAVLTPGGIASLKGVKHDFGCSPDAPEAKRRIKLAEWITDRNNPLFARVMVNRMWHHHFGAGLVETPSDFGFNGGRPSHPELIDWLAFELVPNNYSLKQLHRLIVTSAAYRQTSRNNPAAAKIDADNRLLWRKSPLRLEAEAVRDAMLTVSGKLNDDVGGPGYYDFTTFVRNTQFYFPVDPVGESFYRRSLYRTWVRSGRNRFLDVFDCPDPSTKSPKRAVTTTPLQALSLMNNSFVLRMADRFAERIQRECGENRDRQIRRAYQLSYGRDPDGEELNLITRFVTEHGLSAMCRVIFNSNEFLYVD